MMITDDNRYEGLRTILDVLRMHVTKKPDEVAFHFIREPATGELTSMTYADLDERVRRLGSYLSKIIEPQDRVLLFFPAGLDYIVGFLGCIAAGAIAVPLYPPRKGEKLDRIAHVIGDCGARHALGLGADIDSLRQLPQAELAELAKLQFNWISLEQSASEEPLPAAADTATHQDIAFLQYTSGSTGHPKGVRVSHANLMTNQAAIAGTFESRATDVCLNWLPMYHDMGLIGAILHPLYCGYPSYMLSPVAFIRDPLCWLENITRYRATVAGGPNFCYELCAAHAAAQPERARKLDLSSWRIAFNGAEPVSARSMQRFERAFRGAGFREAAFLPCYGLAEATLLVAGKPMQSRYKSRSYDSDSLAQGRLVASSGSGVSLVSSGRCIANHELRIVNAEHKEVPEGEIGEIWIRGPSVSAGYWNKDAVNTEIFGAHLRDGRKRDSGFLRTGDQGAVQNGELIVTGRIKDLIILKGRNYYPQDIELIAGTAHPALRAGGGAAFACEEGDSTCVVLVHEVDRKHVKSFDAQAVAAAIRSAVSRQLEIVMDEIVFIQPTTLPKTSSGKIRRREARARFLGRALQVLADVPQAKQDARSISPIALIGELLDTNLLQTLPPPALSALIEGVLRKVLSLVAEQPLDGIAPDSTLAAVGLDSMGIVRIQNSLEKALHIRLNSEALFRGISIHELAVHVAQSFQHKSSSKAALAEPAGDTSFALSCSQQPLWFAYELNAKRTDYNLALLIECIPSLDRARLVAAMDEVSMRHPILRTTYHSSVHDNHQTVCERPSYDFQEIQGQDVHEDALISRLREIALTPFDLVNGPILRVRLVTFDGQRSWVLLAIHHVATDFWSMTALTEEIITSASGGTVTRFPHRNYRQWVGEQADYLRSGRAAPDKEHWARVLSGESLSSGLEEAFPSAGFRTGDDAGTRLHNFRIDAELSTQLRQLAQASDNTLNAVSLAAFQLLLHHRSKKQTLAVGTIASGRTGWEYENTQGYFVNPIPLVTELRAEDTFLTFLRRTARGLVDGIVHQAYPFALMVREHAANQRSEQNPFFQAVFLMQQSQHLRGANAFAIKGVSATTHINSVEVTSLPLNLPALPFELIMTLALTDTGIEGMLECGGSRMDSTQIASLVREYCDLLGAVAGHSEIPVRTLITEVLHRSVQIERPDSTGAGSSVLQNCQSLIEAFEQQVRLVPNNIALTFGDVPLTYLELKERAAGLATVLLQSAGLRRSVPVAILLEPGAELVVSIVAVLMAGACYLPLDPNSPSERLQAILEDSRPDVLLSSQAFAQKLGSLPGTAGIRRLFLDELTGGRNAKAPAQVPHADPRAYVIFTSGSTGRPKGVQVTHQNVLRLFTSCEREFNFDSKDVWTLFHSCAFDFSVWEIWGALLYGGRLVVVPYEVTRSPQDFYALVKRERVSVLSQTPSAFKLFSRIDSQLPERLDALRVVVFGGEALLLRNLKGWFEKYRDRRPQMVNMYGITETTVHVTYRLLSLADIEATASLIGRPLNDLTIELVNENLQRVAGGEVGEIIVSGPGVSLGYLGNEPLTRERFIELELDSGQRRRYYLSGDLARRTESGEYEYLGRRDHQVNLNGFRIELGEIESALLKFPGIRSAVVLAQAQLQKPPRIVDSLPRARDEMTQTRQLIRATPDAQEDLATEDKLIAYVVYEIAPEPQALHSHLSRHLPDYMIPFSLIPIDEIPLNQNGKVDVAKLQSQTRNVIVPRAVYVAPQSEEERIWAKLFADVLDRPRVGIHEGFFEMGGDSIRIIQLRSRALKAGLPVSVQDIFRLQTPAALAAATQRTHAEPERPRVAPFAQIGAHERARMPAGVVDAYPLARLQEGLLFHSLYGNDIAMYCDIFEFRFRGPVDVQAFEAAVAELIARHQIFRTSFNFEDFERPLQLVHEKASCEIRVFDSRALDESARRQFQLQRLEKEKRSTYDVSRAPLIRFSLDRQQDDEFILTMSFHDALLDGWSESATIVELLQNYFDIIARGAVQDRPSINTRFADFAAIEQEVLADSRVREFWEAELEDVIPTMLPLEQGPPAPTHQNPVHFLAVDLPAELSDELKAVARQLGVSLKHLLLAAHAAVLSLVCGERDIIMAVESNGRLEDGDGEQVFGSHLNVVPWRIKLDACAWEELIRIIEQKEAALQPYRRYPYQAIQRLKGNHPLSDVSFNYTHFHLYEHLERYSELKVVDAKAYIQTHFVLRVEFNQDPFTRHLTLDLEANIAAMPAERVRRIAQYYRSALTSIARSPNADFRSAPLLSDEELREELVASHGRLDPSLADSVLYLERFDEQARQHGPQVAAVDAQGSISYAQLAEGSWRVAASLQSRRVRPGVVIGVIADRCIDYLQVILGIWRAGAVLLPMPIGPVERLRQIVERAEVRLVICSREYRHFGEQLACPFKPCELEQLCREDLHRQPDPYSPSATDLAYVIFTSGSTGEPKGGMIEHGGMINHIEAKIADIGINRTDKVSQDAAATFDICIWQFCAALLVGGQIRIFEDDIAKDPSNLLSHVKSEGITVLEVSPSVLSSMLLHHKSDLENIEASRADPQPFRKLRCIVSSGEALQPSLVSELRAVHPNAKILNMWGLTETSDDCTHFLIPPGELTAVSIGMPITNAAIYVLDAWRRLVPRGTPGDLYVGGVCVGRGYVNDAERTAAAFLRNIFDYGSYPRLYRTGDRGFRAQDGRLYFIGRRDNQVKIRGQRIEIGEVEAILSKLPIVHEAVVLALPDASNRLALHAWVVPADGQVAVDGSRVRKLRSEMKTRAPTYMVPDTFVFLEHLPKNAHGKIDRKALAALARTQTQSDTDVVPPQTAAEQTVRELFEQILKRQPVSTDWSFFDIGGNSLLATQLVSRAQRHFGVKLAIRSLFEHDTVAAFAAFATAAAGSGAETGHVIERQTRPARIPLSLNQERIFFIGSIDGSGRAYSSHFALKICGALDTGSLGWALRQIIDRHEILRTTFVLTEEGPEQVVAPSMPFSPTLIDLEPLASADRASALERHLAAEIDSPYQLDTLPLCSATIYRLAAQEHVFLWRNHHIIGDGWSAAIMLREIEQLYQVGVRNTPAQLPELPIQFADYAIWQRNYVRSERFAQQMQFWKTYLAGQPGVLALPTDLPRPKALTFEGKRLRVEVSEDLTTRIRAFCKDSRVTLFAFLQSAIALLLSRYAKQNDLLVGSAVANRHRYEVEPLIGFITNTLPIRHRFDPSSTFAEHVRKVNEDLLSVFENQDVPFAHLVQSFIKERDPGNHPLVQVMFVLQNEDLSLPMIDGLRLEELHRDRFAAIMDLLFDLQESGGGIAGNIEFNSNVYTEQTIAVLWRSLTYLMRSIVRNADQPITRLSTIDEDEYRVLSQAWMNLQRGRTEIQFWHRQAVDSPYWEDYLELAERDGLLMSAYLAVSEY